jgi:hypothetical protein
MILEQIRKEKEDKKEIEEDNKVEHHSDEYEED